MNLIALPLPDGLWFLPRDTCEQHFIALCAVEKLADELLRKQTPNRPEHMPVLAILEVVHRIVTRWLWRRGESVQRKLSPSD